MLRTFKVSNYYISGSKTIAYDFNIDIKGEPKSNNTAYILPYRP